MATHYVGIMGPRGTNIKNGTAYKVEDSTTYGGFATQGVLNKDRKIALKQITDGLSQTFAMGEVSWPGYQRYRSWHRGSTVSGTAMGTCKNVKDPINTLVPYGSFNDRAFGSQHPGGTHFLFCDGAVQFIDNDIDQAVFLGRARRDGKELGDAAP